MEIRGNTHTTAFPNHIPLNPQLCRYNSTTLTHSLYHRRKWAVIHTGQKEVASVSAKEGNRNVRQTQRLRKRPMLYLPFDPICQASAATRQSALPITTTASFMWPRYLSKTDAYRVKTGVTVQPRICFILEPCPVSAFVESGAVPGRTLFKNLLVHSHSDVSCQSDRV